MAKIGFALAFVALAFAGWQAYELGTVRDELKTQQDTVSDLRARLDVRPAPVAPAEPALRTATPPPARPETADTTPHPSLSGAGLSGTGSNDGASNGKPLEGTSSLLPGGIDVAKAAGEGKPGDRRLPALGVTGLGGTFYPDVDTAARVLKLDDGQKAQLQSVVDETKKELADLHALKNDDGQTWNELSKVKFEGNAEGGMIAFAANFKKLAEFKGTKVPGTNETFGEADARIRQSGKDRARGVLSPDQAKEWDKSNSNALFGGGMGIVAISVGDVADGATK
jgi:hypothetical protein